MQATGPPRPLYQQRRVQIAAGVVLVLAVVVGLVYYVHASGCESTNDAYIEGRLVRVSAQVAGRIEKLLVTDNQTNTRYFYTSDEGEKPGADLKLRGTIDLSKVGQPVLSPKRTREKDDKK